MNYGLIISSIAAGVFIGIITDKWRYRIPLSVFAWLVIVAIFT